jgi:hypothetical protein
VNRRSLRLTLILIALATAPIATALAATGDDGRPPEPATEAAEEDGGPRNLAAEAASGDIEAMRAVVQDIVDCVREKGYHPGDPEVHGGAVVIGDWNPDWGSPAHDATHECAFPDP